MTIMTTPGSGSSGRFYGVGVGPGDPELITLKAARLIGSAAVIAYHAGRPGSSNARRIAAGLFPDGVIEEELVYPVTTGTTDHPGGYAGALAEFYEEASQRLAAHLDAGRDVVLLAEGDPLFFGSYMYMHDRLAERYPTEVVAGIPAFAAATATVGAPLVRQTDVLSILPGTLPRPELARRLADTDGAIIMKLGRTFPEVREALAEAGRLDGALYVERASMDTERWLPVAEVDPATVPYFSLIVVPGDTASAASVGRAAGEGRNSVGRAAGALAEACRDQHRNFERNRVGLDTDSLVPHESGSTDGEGRNSAGRAAVVRDERRCVETNTVDSVGLDTDSLVPHESGSTDGGNESGSTDGGNESSSTSGEGEVVVVGLGPGPQEWLTPEAAEALAEVDHVVGYGPYVNRVPQRPGLTRHASGNTVEVDRARLALDLARSGEKVAVVSGGDAGVFGMASAVFEAAETAPDAAYAGVRIRVLPGVSAIQAVAARAGAPVGADFAVVSLSDRLKPWPVIERRLRAIAEADLVLGIYNPASRSRREQIVNAHKLLLEHRSPETVVVIGRDIGRAEESLTVTTLGALDTDAIDMKCLVLVGASSTRVTGDGRVWTPRFVEKTP